MMGLTSTNIAQGVWWLVLRLGYDQDRLLVTKYYGGRWGL